MLIQPRKKQQIYVKRVGRLSQKAVANLLNGTTWRFRYQAIAGIHYEACRPRYLQTIEDVDSTDPETDMQAHWKRDREVIQQARALL